ncbi:unannotated protein [freshwater metagenome]|uniref:Unannotated protein n=1 Tax=freshwater metagenome TaxID=449393 RepID=A0A6J6PAX1_9ZZZZ
MYDGPLIAVRPLLQGCSWAQVMISPASSFSRASKAFHWPPELPVPRASTVSWA